MIIVKLIGGLGNQMFQYAYGRSLSIKANDVLKLDMTGYYKQSLMDIQEDTRRIYTLDKYNVKTEIATEEEIKKLNPIWRKIWNKAWNKLRGYTDLYIYDKKKVIPKKNAYYQGFWPSEKYFADISDTIRKDLTLKNPMQPKSIEVLQKIEAVKNSGRAAVCLHVRRSDYVTSSLNLKSFGICSIDYYKKAYEEIEKRLGKDAFELFMVSDDMPWVKENFSFPIPIHYISDNENIPDYEEVEIMSKCDHYIIANSTFSWWGAWLNPNPKKIVIAPKRWVVDPQKDTRDVFPPEWILIDA